jgi:hypothetical protein
MGVCVIRSSEVEFSGEKWVEVRPFTRRRETLVVSAAMLAVVCLMILRFTLIPGKSSGLVLKSYQQLSQKLEPPDQLIYRSLLSSVTDVLDLADDLGQWPEAGLLEEAGVPPFAAGFLPAPVDRLIWVGYDGGTWVDYLGHDLSGRLQASYILRLIDLHGGYHPHPHPGVDYDPNQAIAVQIWRFDKGQRAYPGERLPEAGWIWLIDENDPLLRRQPGAAEETQG